MRYFFDISEGDGWAADDRGVECANDRDARRQAVLALAEMAREDIPPNVSSMDLTVRVRHGANVAFTVHLDFSTDPGPALTDSTMLEEHD